MLSNSSVPAGSVHEMRGTQLFPSLRIPKFISSSPSILHSRSGGGTTGECSDVTGHRNRTTSSGRRTRDDSAVRLLPRASSSSSFTTSPSEFPVPNQNVEEETKQKRRERVAGIYQDELVEPSLLADPDSCFCEFKGLHIHHKVHHAHSLPSDSSHHSSHANRIAVPLPMILLHGFGASVFSWTRAMRPLAELTGSKVLAFDRPAFGLTTRVNSFTTSLNPYSMEFSVLTTLHFIDFLGANKAILVGHSAGSLVAVESYFEAPERVAALILVAPAIFAPRTVDKTAKTEQSGTKDQADGDREDSNVHVNPLIRLFMTLSKVTKYIAEAIVGLVRGMTAMLSSLYRRALSAFLRSSFAVMLVRMVIDKFGIAGVRNAWFDSMKVTEHVLQGYTKPLRTKGWDRALVEYTAAMLTDTNSASKPPLAKRLNEISCPVLIVTGDNDRIVPSWNAERLSRAIPGSSFEVIKSCGHLPQEEKVEEFVSIVENFLQKAFGYSEEQRLQAAI